MARIGAHLLLVEQPVEQPVRRQHRIEQLVILDRLGERLGARPILFGEGAALPAPRPPSRVSFCTSSPPARQVQGRPPRLPAAIMPRHGKPDEGRQLLGLAEIDVGGLGQAFAFERHHALIALGLGARGRWSWRDGPARELARRAASAASRSGEKRA